MSNLNEIERESFLAVSEILEASRIKPGDIFVVGCSSSEVLGEKIGTDTNLDVAGAIYDGVIKALNEKAEQPIFLAAQCCEHLNRALVVERACMEKYGFEQVNAIPQPNHAGGAFATVAYQRMQDPVLVESIEARGQAGIDIGGTLIGMHIHPVVVPLRISLKKIGEANIICARRRPKYVGGQRAIYDESLL
ncbi:MAG: TIGR01440 family protein [Oribacterium sp.]|nr:TIGR01440 family protein [Oribacterium sp.]MDY6317037.1 TIGR01440 family protein [Oribacterium sp.]